MPARRKATLPPTRASRRLRKNGMQVAAAETPTLEMTKDPFERIPLECCDMILSYLAVSDLGRSELVCTSWKRLVTSWISSFGIAVHFLYAVNPRSGTDDDLALEEFKRLACQECALRHGEPRSVRRFPNAYHFTTAGDFAAWASENDDLINYQRLQEGTVTMAVKLRNIGEWNQLNWVKGVGLNSDGFLLVRLQSGPSIYDPLDPTFPRSYRDVVYSLESQKIVWSKESQDIDHHELPQHTPLCIGKDRVYFAERSSKNAYDLVSYDFRTGARLYQTPVVASIHHEDRGYMPQRTLELIQLANDELIVQFDSSRLLSPTLTFGKVDSFAIINGADGRVQTIACSGLQRCGRAFANARSNSIALVGSTVRHGEMIIQKFSQRSDKTFLQTAVHVVSMLSDPVAVHPFTFHVFFIPFRGSCPQASSLTQDQDLQTCSKMDTVVPRWGPEVVVDAYHRTVPGQPLTLPPRKPKGCGRRPLRLDMKRTDSADLTPLDGGRFLLDLKRYNPGSISTSDKYLFSFAPK